MHCHSDAVESQPSAGSTGRFAPAAHAVAMALLAVVVGTTFFTGLEKHPCYSGCAIQSIEKGTFQTDEFMSPNRPIMNSLLYKAIVPPIGALWLDDRFLVLLNCFLAWASLAGFDRILQVFGLTKYSCRFVVLLLLSYPHLFVNNLAHVINPFEFNPTSFSRPLSIWMFYFAFSRGKQWRTVLFGLLLLAMSIKNAWMPCLLCLLVFCYKCRPTLRWSILSVAAAVPLMILLGYHFFCSADGSTSLLWEVLKAREGSEANPFLVPSTAYSWIAWLEFVGLFVLAIGVRLPDQEAQAHVRRIMFFSLLFWFASGVYLTWAPAFLQVPPVVPFSLNRGSWLPQLIAYAALATWALAQRRGSGSAAAVLAITVLMALPMERKPTALLAALLVANSVFWAVLQRIANRPTDSRAADRGFLRQIFVPARAGELILMATLGMFVSIYAAYGAFCNRAALRTLCEKGVLGSNSTALWIDVARYLHDNTPRDAVVLSLNWERDGSSRDDYRVIPADQVSGPDDLVANGTLRSRSGRANLAPELYCDIMSYQHHLFCHARWDALNRLGKAWKEHDGEEVDRLLKQAGRTPDYIVVPATEAAWIAIDRLPYRPVATIRQFTVLEHCAQDKPPEAEIRP
jgi:hypothetical protein